MLKSSTKVETMDVQLPYTTTVETLDLCTARSLFTNDEREESMFVGDPSTSSVITSDVQQIDIPSGGQMCPHCTHTASTACHTCWLWSPTLSGISSNTAGVDVTDHRTVDVTVPMDVDITAADSNNYKLSVTLNATTDCTDVHATHATDTNVTHTTDVRATNVGDVHDTDSTDVHATTSMDVNVIDVTTHLMGVNQRPNQSSVEHPYTIQMHRKRSLLEEIVEQMIDCADCATYCYSTKSTFDMNRICHLLISWMTF